MRSQPVQPCWISQDGQVLLGDNRADKVPETVRRMGVILLRRQRSIAWQAAKDEEPRTGRADRREGRFTDQDSVRTSVSLPVTAAAAAMAGETR